MYSTSTTAPAHVVHPSLTRGGRGETGPSAGLGQSNVVHAKPMPSSSSSPSGYGAAPGGGGGGGGGHWGGPSRAYGGDINTVGGAAGGAGVGGGGVGAGALNTQLIGGYEMSPAAAAPASASADGVRRRQNHQHQHLHHPTAASSVAGASMGGYQPTPLGLAAERGDVPAVNVFLRGGHDPDAPGPHGRVQVMGSGFEGFRGLRVKRFRVGG